MKNQFQNQLETVNLWKHVENIFSMLCIPCNREMNKYFVYDICNGGLWYDFKNHTCLSQWSNIYIFFTNFFSKRSLWHGLIGHNYGRFIYHRLSVAVSPEEISQVPHREDWITRETWPDGTGAGRGNGKKELVTPPSSRRSLSMSVLTPQRRPFGRNELLVLYNIKPI